MQAPSQLPHPVQPPPTHRFPSVLLSALAAILILCACIGTGTYLYTYVTQLVSEYRRHLNSSADSAQLFFDQREAMLRAVAATAVPSKEVAFIASTHTLRPLTIPATSHKNRYQLLLTRRHWNAIQRSGTLVFSQMDPAITYRLYFKNEHLHWQKQHPPLSLRLKPITTNIQNRQVSVIWLRQPESSNDSLIAYTPLARYNPESGWLGIEFSHIGHALTLNPPPPNTEYTLFDTRRQTVLYSSTPSNTANAQWVEQDFFGFDRAWFPKYIILSKSLGTGGLRVSYAMPTRNVLHDGKAVLLTAFLTLTVITTVVLLGTHVIRRRLLLPARQQQQRLLDSVSLNQKLISMAPIGLALVNQEGSIVFQQNQHAKDWMEHDALWRSRLPTGHEQHASHDVELMDGRTLRITAIALTYRDHPAALCSVLDVTAENAEKASLRQAQYIAESANIAKTQFLTTMSHEIRTPLYGILGTLELMTLAEPQLQHSPHMETLRRSAQTLFHVVGESLDLSRIEAGYMPLEPREFFPQELVDTVIAAFTAAAQQKGLLLYSLTPTSALTAVIGDVVKINQILSNLISNAIKFTMSGHVVLRLHIHPHSTTHLALRFQVVDSGQGICADAIPNLFQPYFNHPNNNSSQPSTGLGLSICQRLATLMEGSLTVISEPGLGTSITFEVVLPKVSTNSTNTPPSVRLAPQPVYIAGDIPEITSNLCQWLRHWGAYSQIYDGQVATPDAVLVRAWPCSTSDIRNWTGHQVIAQPSVHTTPPSNNAEVRHTLSTSIREIGLAVQEAQLHTSCTARNCYGPRAYQDTQPHILVVDDNPINRQILKEQLTILGWHVHVEASAESALDIPEIDRFPIILTDLFLPGMNGYTFARTLRLLGYRGRIIGITANAIHDNEWISAKMDLMLTKPLSMAVLRDHLPKHPSVSSV